MKIGIIVDGVAELDSLAGLYPRLGTPHQLLKALRAKRLHPLASVGQIVEAVEPAVQIQSLKGANLIIVLLDREDRDVCPGQWAQELTAELNARYGSQCKFAVVIKNACYENWLVSDPIVFGKMPKRFQMSNTVISSIRPNKADRVAAQSILKSAAQRGSYDKIADAIRIMILADPQNMAANSRSFRRFLRVIENPSYLQQSRDPAARLGDP